MQKSSVGGWAPWGHMYFCVGVRLTGLTVRALTKLAVSEPVPMASFKIRSSFNKSSLEEKFLQTQGVLVCPVSVAHYDFSCQWLGEARIQFFPRIGLRFCLALLMRLVQNYLWALHVNVWIGPQDT